MFGLFMFGSFLNMLAILFGGIFSLIILLSWRRRGFLETLRRVFVGALLAILIPLAMIYGIKAFMPEPVRPMPVDTWKRQSKLRMLEQQGETEKLEKLKAKIAQKQQEYDEKFKQYEHDMTGYVRIRRIIATFIGVTFIILGALLADYFLGAGFIVGGALCIANATLDWWYKLSEVARFAIIIGALLLLFIIGYILIKRARKKM